MTAKTMAEVLAEHVYKSAEAVCSCSDFVQVGLRCDAQTHPQHVAEVLSAAGFGLVADAKGEAWDEGYGLGYADCKVGASPTRTNPHRALCPICNERSRDSRTRNGPTGHWCIQCQDEFDEIDWEAGRDD